VVKAVPLSLDRVAAPRICEQIKVRGNGSSLKRTFSSRSIGVSPRKKQVALSVFSGTKEGTFAYGNAGDIRVNRGLVAGAQREASGR
jgi:hypothetical protein